METARLQKEERSPGLDLLRILCMLLVVVLHLMGRGGLLSAATPFTANYEIAWLLESAAYCAVDGYAILSGYLLCASRCRLGNLLGLWIQVFFYSAGITSLFAIFYEPVSLPRFLQSCFPVLFTQYWYFTAYFAVYCFAPFLNRLIAPLSQGAFRRLVGTIFVLLSLLPTVTGQDAFVTGGGYSFLWLAALYLIGAYWRCYPPKNRRSGVWFAGYAACVLALFLFRLAVERYTFRHDGAVSYGGWLLTYPSPLVVGAAACLFLGCRALCVGKPVRRIVAFMAPGAFGVYLIHAQPFVFHRLLDGAAVPWLAYTPWRFAAVVLLAAVGIFLVCALIDRLRGALFTLLRIPRLTRRLGDMLERLLPQLPEP